MARQRRSYKPVDNNDIHYKEKRKRSSNHNNTLGRKILLYTALVIIVVFSVVYLYFQYCRKIHVVTPLQKPRAVVQTGLRVPERFWGTYRPNCYFGLKTRSPLSPVFGLMWFAQTVVDNQLPLRHWCEQGDRLPKYGWLEHDGINFGKQEIEENYFKIKTEVVKRPGGQHGGDWSTRISVTPKVPNFEPFVSVIFYVALDGQGRIQPVLHGSYLAAIQGDSEELGPFRVSFETSSTTVKMANYLMTVAPGLHQLKETVLKSFGIFQLDKAKGIKVIGLVGNQMKDSNEGKKPNFLAYQATFTLPFEMEVIFESGSYAYRPNRLVGEVLTNEINKQQEGFNERFEKTFGLASKNYSEDEIAFAKATLSNLLGGIGYFVGSSLVQSQFNPEPIKYWPTALYTAVPSRSFFPRGFLWDEGFHNLLICQWDTNICQDIIAHWLDLLNIEGWIPRELILGVEARSKVPDEFVVQHNTNANPPTLFLALQYLLYKMREYDTLSETDRAFLERIYPRLEVWFEWYNTTQTGKIKTSFRWRGRDAETTRELNPKTLTSGLDDFPRASHPTEDERHVDLRCWMVVALSVLVEIGDTLGRQTKRYSNTLDSLMDKDLLDELHWAPELGQYADYGLHTGKVKLERPKPKNIQNGRPVPKQEKVRVVLEEPQLQFVDQFGYVNLFPFLTYLIDPSSPKLGILLHKLKQPDLLWTKYGLRSLAKNSSIYMKHNTEHDPPYWRGTLWMNINFLALRALNHYGTIEGPYKTLSNNLYHELKTNLITNLYREYVRTGYVWEQYSDTNGRGQGSHPFTGWSSLIVLIMADSY